MLVRLSIRFVSALRDTSMGAFVSVPTHHIHSTCPTLHPSSAPVPVCLGLAAAARHANADTSSVMRPSPSVSNAFRQAENAKATLKERQKERGHGCLRSHRHFLSPPMGSRSRSQVVRMIVVSSTTTASTHQVILPGRPRRISGPASCCNAVKMNPSSEVPC
jgi:hypothetical protein